MAGSKESYAKARLKLLERYGGEEGLRRHQQEIGAAGGRKVTANTKGRGFGSLTHEELIEVASKGGRAVREQ